MICLSAAMAFGASSASLTMGKAELKSAGPLAFGPDGILFVGDSAAAAVVALDTADQAPCSGANCKVEIKGVNQKIAALLGTSADQILINDMAVNPVSKNVYISVSRGRGPDAMPVILRATASGKISEVTLANIKHSMVSLPDAPSATTKDGRGQSPRLETITHLAFVNGSVIVAGLLEEGVFFGLFSLSLPVPQGTEGGRPQIFPRPPQRGGEQPPGPDLLSCRSDKAPHT